MPKRKPHTHTTSSDSDTDSLLPITFDFFPPAPQDYPALKSLLTQLFHTSAPSLPTPGLADTILDHPALGTCVKCEDADHTPEENDPFAFLACVDLWERREEPGVKGVVGWLRRNAGGGELEGLGRVLDDMGEKQRVGLILAERLVNMPPAVAPPLWRLLLEELESAGEGDPYWFSHFVLVSKSYVEVAGVEVDSEEEEHRGKKARVNGKKGKRKTVAEGETMFFHPEDEVLMRHACVKGGFEYEGEEEGRSAFTEAGIKARGLVVVIERGRLKEAVGEVGVFVEGEGQ